MERPTGAAQGSLTAAPVLVVRLVRPEDFERFYRRELPGLTVLARALSGSQRADGVARRAMLAALRRWDEVSLLESPGAWLRTRAAAAGTSVVRRRLGRARELLPLGAAAGGYPELDPEAEAFWTELRRRPPAAAVADAVRVLDAPAQALDEPARSAAEQLWSTTVEGLDLDRSYRALLRARRRSPARRAVAVLAAGALGLAGWAALRPEPAHPVPRPAPAPASRLTLVTPLCDHPGWQLSLPDPYHRPARCPLVTPAGSYASALIGVSTTMPFTFALPSGWTVSPPATVGGLDRIDGIDLQARGTSTGLTVFSYPRPVAVSSGRVVSAQDTVRWLRSIPYVRSTPVRQTFVGNRPALSVDVHLTADAPLTGECRVARTCVPVLETLFGTSGVAMELHPGVTSRLLVFDGASGGLPGAVWVWRTDDPPNHPTATLSTVMSIIASMHFENAV